MKVWVTGASGMLGRCVGQRLSQRGVSWIGTDLDVDIADESAVRRFTDPLQLAGIINCAAYTAVDNAETDPANAFRVNAEGPRVLAQTCQSLHVPFVHVSTDYVFDGEGAGEHVEDAPTGPCNVYGHSKLQGERNVLEVFARDSGAQGRWQILRTSWLFGAGRSSFVETMWRLMVEKPELRIVDDQVGRPTYADDLAEVALVASGLSSGVAMANGIWHFANAGAVSWYQFALGIRDCLLSFGEPLAVKAILPVSSSEFPRPARRPRNSVLSTQRIEAEAHLVPRRWQDALSEFVQLQVKLRGAR